jgi:hypothetical protein
MARQSLSVEDFEELCRDVVFYDATDHKYGDRRLYKLWDSVPIDHPNPFVAPGSKPPPDGINLIVG